ncbi:hypothetical protein LSUE1_G004498 [Lachnellula suecica]|uniref:HIT-type domain-containing protein n=1 Tax=Lachnellula suecica TaxID=602035 RepID=A0A8T9C2J8_9HELO|nr:hypothetical protein LSUE1_G004498 [Lachnellula suecica]
MNFGVLEVATSKATAAPGWAYVADTTVNSSTTALQPRKRAARNQAAPSLHETTARQETKILRELAALDRENHRDVSIPVPVRHRDLAGRASVGKGTTPGVRKILQSQKNFANHLTDFQALGSVLPPAPAAPSTPAVPTPRPTAYGLNSKGNRSHKKKDPAVVSTPTPLRRVSTANTPQPIKTEDTPMPDAPPSSLVLSDGASKAPAPHKEDKNPLLVSRIPGMPSQAEIEKLLSAPALSYEEARGSWAEEDQRKPVRVFCEVCGYWGRVRCMRCGGKVCALECLSTHQEECFARYGA